MLKGNQQEKKKEKARRIHKMGKKRAILVGSLLFWEPNADSNSKPIGTSCVDPKPKSRKVISAQLFECLGLSLTLKMCLSEVALFRRNWYFKANPLPLMCLFGGTSQGKNQRRPPLRGRLPSLAFRRFPARFAFHTSLRFSMAPEKSPFTSSPKPAIWRSDDRGAAKREALPGAAIRKTKETGASQGTPKSRLDMVLIKI